MIFENYDCSKGSKRLKDLRKNAKKISHLTLSKETGINIQSLKNYERAGEPDTDGRVDLARKNAFAGMSVSNLVTLAKYFGVSTDYLLGLTDIKSPSSKVSSICKYTGLSTEAVEQLHAMFNDDGADLGNVSAADRLLAMDRLISAMGDDSIEESALADIADYLQADFDDMKVMTSSSSGFDKDKMDRIARAALERAALDKVGTALKELKSTYYQKEK